MPGLPIYENTIADMAAKASLSVVNISSITSITISRSPSSQYFPYEFPGNGSQQQEKLEAKHTGSGVIIRSDGYILTNSHVVGPSSQIKVTLYDKRIFPGKVIGRDSFTDLALVKIQANNLPIAHLGTSKSLRPGDLAVAIGSPLGLDRTVTLGIVSALNRSIADLNNNVELVQTDAAINPGNSGGPLLNIRGDVIGINTAIEGNAQNIGFAIPVDTAKEVAEQLLANKKISRAYLGIYMQDLTPDLAKALGLDQAEQGVLVSKVLSGTAGARAGLSVGDVISRVDGKAVASSQDVQKQVRNHKPGDNVTLTLTRRNGMQRNVSVTVGQYPTVPEEGER